MKKLMNLAIASGMFTDKFHSDYDQVKTFLNEVELDGIEMILYGDYDLTLVPENMIYGHHLLYWPNWLNFWLQDEKRLKEDFLSMENVFQYYGFEGPEGIVQYLKNEYKVAKDLGVDYMVMHISHAGFREVFTFDHYYEDQEVFEASIDLINQVFEDQEGPMLLFENLWWPGLTFRDVERTKWFYDQIQYNNKGFVLDITHLLSTNKEISSMDEGIEFIHQVLDDMGPMVDDIKVIHLSKTLAGEYLSGCHDEQIKKYDASSDIMDRFKIIYPHIHQIDRHEPFDDLRINEIIDRVKPEFLVYELKASTLEELSEKIGVQQKYVKEFNHGKLGRHGKG